MLKRTAALLFIFAIAGQVYAGVCGCLGSGERKQHSCCKKQNSAGDSIKSKGCCDSDCIASRHEQIAADRTEPAGKIKFQALTSPSRMPLMPFEPVAVAASRSARLLSEPAIRYSRPPDLYLHHCAFLI